MRLLSILPLAAFAAASPVVPIEEYIETLDKRASVSTSELNEFKFYAQHAGAAYCNYDVSPGEAIRCSSNVCPDVQNTGAYAVWSDVGFWTGIGAYVAVDDWRSEIVLSIRGSNNIRNFITDVVFAKTDCDFTSGCEVHTGFSDAWGEISSGATNAIRNAVARNPGYRVVATGHSLGAAVATIAVADLRPQGFGTIDLYTFGSPRVGNDNFVNFVDRQAGAEYRVTHLDDPVPRLPPIIFGYRHTSPEYWLKNGGATTNSYGVNDIKVCTGIATTGCNAGTDVGLDIPAHLHYFEAIGSCGNPFKWRRDVSDEELAGRLSGWAKQDQEWVANNM